MRILSVIGIGAVLALLWTVLFLYLSVYRDLPPHTTPGLDGIERFTIANPWYWMGIVVAFFGTWWNATRRQPDAEETLKRIRAIAAGSGDRIERAKQLAETVRSLGNYRWTGVYDVGSELVSIIAYSSASSGAHVGGSGPGAPAHPTFPIAKGLTGSAIREKATVVVGDVRSDPRYLTAFGNTLSEIIVPIVHPQTGAVIGTIDVESERANAFSLREQKLLEECGCAALPLWMGS